MVEETWILTGAYPGAIGLNVHVLVIVICFQHFFPIFYLFNN